ncbi:MAG: hypothetical protein GXN93_00765 [Candidatus Diapherotrites archaeon]|nr:hypothetical protein [Candidatus Diapherotrites archaeon]
MGVFAVVRRAVSDSLDLGLALLVVLVEWGITYAFMDVLTNLFSQVISPLLVSPSFSYAFLQTMVSAIISFLFQPTNLLILLVYGFLQLYLFMLVISWIGRRRTGQPSNPFAAAFHRLLSAFVLFLIVYAPIYLLVLLIPVVPAGWVPYLFWATLFLYVFYLPIVLPSFAALGIDQPRISDALRHGTFVGKRHYWTIIFGLIFAAVILLAVEFVFSDLFRIWPNVFFGYFLYALAMALYVVLPVAVITETYILDVHGE